MSSAFSLFYQYFETNEKKIDCQRELRKKEFTNLKFVLLRVKEEEEALDEEESS